MALKLQQINKEQREIIAVALSNLKIFVPVYYIINTYSVINSYIFINGTVLSLPDLTFSPGLLGTQLNHRYNKLDNY